MYVLHRCNLKHLFHHSYLEKSACNCSRLCMFTISIVFDAVRAGLMEYSYYVRNLDAANLGAIGGEQLYIWGQWLLVNWARFREKKVLWNQMQVCAIFLISLKGRGQCSKCTFTISAGNDNQNQKEPEGKDWSLQRASRRSNE